MSATADERLIVMLEARISEFEKRMGQAERRGTRTYQGLRRHSRTATRAMEQDMARSTTRINQALASTSTRIGAFGRSFVGGLAAGAAATAIGMVTTSLRQTVAGIAAVGDEARRAGMGVEAFQQWGFVAEQNRIGIDAMVDGFKELNLRADEWIVTGAGPAAEAFTRLGFSAEDLQRRLEDPSELMLEIFRRVENLDRAGQIRVFDEVLGGTAGERFVELLGQGERGLRRTLDRAREVGRVIEEDMVQQAAEVDRQFNELAASVGNYGKRVALAFAEGALEALRLRADIDDAFRDPGQADALAGEDVAEAYREDGRAALEAADATARLRQEYERLGDRADVLRASLTGSASQLRSYGYEDAATAVAQAAAEMETLVGQMQRGEVTGEDFQLRLDGILTSATEAFGTLEEGDKIEFTLVTSALGALSTILEETRGRAAATVEELREIAGLQSDLGMTTGTPLAHAIMPQDLLGGRRSRPARRAPREGELDPGGSGGGSGGGGSTESYAATVAQIRERTEALNLEAAALIATAASGQEYGDAIEYARRRAELMLAAQREGRELTPELQAEIDELARAYTDAGNAAERSAEQLQQVEDRAQRGAERVVDLFGRMAEGGDSARRAVLDLIAELLRMRAIEGLSGLAKSGGGGLLGSLVSFLGFSEGGYTGDGGRLEPKGVVHGGEYVFSKRAVQAIGVARLERMHEAAKGYANGGYVGTAPAGSASAVSGKIEIDLSPDLEARILEGAAKQSVQITQKTVQHYDRLLPGRVKQIQANPRRTF